MRKVQKNPMPSTLFVQVLLFRDGSHWVAQGLEFDIAAQGRTQAETKRAFERTFVGRLIWNVQNGRPLLDGMEEAPLHYREIARTVNEKKQQLSPPRRIAVPRNSDRDLRLPPAYMIPVIQQGHHKHS